MMGDEAFRRERDAMEAWKTGHGYEETPILPASDIRLTPLDEHGQPTGEDIPLHLSYESTDEQLDRNEVTMLVASGSWCAPSETIYDLSNASYDEPLDPGGMFNADGDLLMSPTPTVREQLAGHLRRAALWAGDPDVVPTEAERQMAADWLYEQGTLEMRHWFDTGVFLGKVEAHVFSPLGQEVLDLHARTESGICDVCVTGWETSVEWPCASARLVLAHEGIDIPEELVYDKPEVVLQDHDNPRWPFPAKPIERGFTFPSVSVNRGGITYPTPKDPT